MNIKINFFSITFTLIKHVVSCVMFLFNSANDIIVNKNIYFIFRTINILIYFFKLKITILNKVQIQS